MKVLLATDGSPEATNAVQAANRLLSPSDRNLDLICVAPGLRQKGIQQNRRAAYEQRVMGGITQILGRACATLGPDAGVVRFVKAIGSPAAVIVHRTGDYDLTVVGARGRGTSPGVGLGPVASRVVEHAESPVLVARELAPEGENLRILAAVDGSTASFSAIETLRALFDLRSAEICLMHVAETPWVQFGLEDEWSTYSEEDKEQSEAGVLEKELVDEGAGVLERARDLLLPSKTLSVSTRVDEGNPANEILSEAERGQYDLIVVGATGSRDLKHRMLGSVSSKIAWNAPCSVLIVHETE